MRSNRQASTAIAAIATLLLAGVSFDRAYAQEQSTVVVAVPDLGSEDWKPNLDAGSQRTVYDLVNETFIGLDGERNHIPRIVKAWEVSEDGLTWHFTLQEGIQFHDGWGEMTAEDVKFTWEMFTSPETVLARVEPWRRAVSGNTQENFEIINDYEFVLHGDTPNVLLMNVLSYHTPTMQIQSKKYWETVGEEQARKHPIGTGPFRFVSQTPGVEVVLEAVKDHWRHTPSFDRMIVKVVADEAARFAQVRAGELDIAQVTPAVAAEAQAVGLDIVVSQNAYQCNIHPGGIYPYEELEQGYSNIHKPDLPWNQDDNPERGLAIRKAMSLAIDRELIASSLLPNMAKPARAPINLAYITDPTFEPAAYDPDLARKLLEEGGFPDGFTIDMPIFEQSGREAGAEVAHAVAGMWEQELGIKVNRVPMQFQPTFRAFIEQRTTGDPLPGSDAVGKVYLFCQNFEGEPASQLSTSAMPGGSYSHLHHEAAQEMVPKILQNADPDERRAMHAELGRRLAEDYVAFGVIAGVAPAIISAKIASWPVLPGRGEYNNLEHIELKQ
jgi:peptide/nickel transport system substrate-binding protein